MRENLFKGSYVAVVTPFTLNNEIDIKALYGLIEWHIQEGTDGILCLGCTGESSTLDRNEKVTVIKTCLKASRKRIPIVVGTGSNNTKETIEFTRIAKELKVDGCMVVVPYFNKPTPKGCWEHFSAVAKVDLPTMLYHTPGRTGVKLPVQTIAELYDEKKIAAVKESSNDLAYASQIFKASSIPVLSGDDDLNFSILKQGGAGSVSVIANIKPKEWKKMVAFALAGCFDESEVLSKNNSKLISSLFWESNPGPIKYLLSLMDKCLPKLRLPLVVPEDHIKEKLKQIALEYELIQPNVMQLS